MKLISTTLTNSRAHEIGDALRSVVDWVDECIVIDTGVTDNTLEIAKEICGEKLVLCKQTHERGSFRNMALNSAAVYGADWAITLDTDERILHPENLRSILETAPEEVLLMYAADGSYAKERIFRIPAMHSWMGRCHEYYPSDSKRVLPASVATFHELPKTPEQLRVRLLGDLPVLLRQTATLPAEARWWFYLGETYRGLEYPELALSAYVQCVQCVSNWPEQAAVACLRAAECLAAYGRYSEALGACLDGLARDSGIGELADLAGKMCKTLGREEEAGIWSRMHEAIGKTERTVFRG